MRPRGPMGLMRLMRPMGPIRPMGLMGLIGLIGLMLAGCSSSEEVVVPAEELGTAIAFDTDMSEKAVTRSSTPLEEKSNSFKVWSFKNTAKDADDYTTPQTIMPGYVVRWTANTAATTTTNTHDWEYILLAYPSQAIKYWDFAAKAYRFVAVAPDNAGTFERNEDGDDGHYADDHLDLTLLSVDATNAVDAPYFSHLWFSDNTAKPYGQPVTLEFLQPFAKVRYMFTYSTPPLGVSAPDIGESDFRPAIEGQRIALMGDITISYPICGAATEEIYAVDVDWSKYLVSLTRPYVPTVDEYWETVLPVGEQVAYQITVAVNGENRTATVPAQFMRWLPGYTYTYIFKVNDDGGVELENVQVAKTEWKSGKDGDKTLYNW